MSYLSFTQDQVEFSLTYSSQCIWTESTLVLSVLLGFTLLCVMFMVDEYYKYRRRFKQLECQYNKKVDEVTILQSKNGLLSDSIKSMEANQRELQNHFTQFELKIKKYEKEIQEERNCMQDDRLGIQYREKDVDQKIAHHTKMLEEIQRQSKNVEKTSKDTQLRLEEAKSLQREMNKREEALKKLRSMLDIEKADFEKHKRTSEESQQRIENSIKKEKVGLVSQNHAEILKLSTQIKKLETENKSYKATISNLESTMAEIERKKTDNNNNNKNYPKEEQHSSQTKELIDENQACKAKISELKSPIEQIGIDNTRANESNPTKEVHLSQIKELEEKNKSYQSRISELEARVEEIVNANNIKIQLATEITGEFNSQGCVSISKESVTTTTSLLSSLKSTTILEEKEGESSNSLANVALRHVVLDADQRRISTSGMSGADDELRKKLLHARSRSDWKDPVGFLNQSSSGANNLIPDHLNIQQLIEMYDRFSNVPNLKLSSTSRSVMESEAEAPLGDEVEHESKVDGDDDNKIRHFEKLMNYWSGIAQRVEVLEKENASLRSKQETL